MSRKRQRAIISQDETQFATEADDAEMDLVGETQAIIGGDRSSAAIRIKASPMPSKPGIYKGGFNIKDRVLSRLASNISPPVDFTLVQNDFDGKSNSGGWQLVFDSVQQLTRTTTGTTDLGLDSWTASAQKSQDTAEISIFRSAYRKLGNDVNSYTVAAVESTNVNETQLPSLFVSNYVNNKIYNNLGTNTIVLELWDMMCTEDTSMSPCQAWSKDLYVGGYGSTFNGTTITPTTTVAMRKSWGDPGVRPRVKRDKTLFDLWKTLRCTRYLMRPGQTVSHVTSLPNTEITHTKLYGYSQDGTATENHKFIKDLSVCTMGFAIGELCYNEALNSQQISTSSVFLQGRSTIEFTGRTLPRLRERYTLMTDYAFASATSRMTYYPSIPTIDQKYLSQAQPGVEVDVDDVDVN